MGFFLTNLWHRWREYWDAPVHQHVILRRVNRSNL